MELSLFDAYFGILGLIQLVKYVMLCCVYQSAIDFYNKWILCVDLKDFMDFL